MKINLKYIFYLFLLLVLTSSCSTSIKGYRVQGGSKKRALSYNHYSTKSGSKYNKIKWGSTKQQRKSYKFNYGKYNSFGGKNKKHIFGSDVRFSTRNKSNGPIKGSNRHGIFSWLKKKNPGVPQTRKKKFLHLRLFDSKFNSQR